MTDVFISYKQEEREKMRPIADALSALQVDVWFDERLSPDRSFTEEIQHLTQICKAQLVCWSPSATASEWVRGEAEKGRQRGVLVAVMVEACELPPPFNMHHAENLTGWNGDRKHPGWRKVLETIGRKIDRPGLAELDALSASSDSEAWKRWAQKYPNDPCADAAWSKIEELEIGAARARTAQQREAAKKAAAEAAAKPKPQTSRPASSDNAASFRSAAFDTGASQRKSPPWPLIIVGAIAAVGVLGFMLKPAPAPAPGVQPGLFGLPGQNPDEIEAIRKAEEEKATQAAQGQADDNAYAIAQAANTIRGYEMYLSSYPNGRNAEQARAAQQALQSSFAPAPSAAAAAAPANYSAFDVDQLNASVKYSAQQARNFEERGKNAATRARNGEAGMESYKSDKGGGYDGEKGKVGDPLVGASTTAGGDSYTGQYVYAEPANRREGYGVYIWSNGNIYEGQFANSVRAGYGVLWDKQGKLISSGIWKDDYLSTSLSK
ncbi:MAG: TIR domain-containing protein [Caulobacterales bacterium]